MRMLLVALLLCVPARAGFPATYYGANQGADRNDGLSPQTAWVSFSRVNAAAFRPGDTIILPA